MATREKLTARDLVYQLLKDAGEKGVSQVDLYEAGASLVTGHIESLRCEGHGIETVHGSRAYGVPVIRWVLVKDAWADAA